MAKLPAGAELEVGLDDGLFTDARAHQAGLRAAGGAIMQAEAAVADRTCPEVPAGANVSLELVRQFLEDETPGLFLLHTTMKVREADVRTAVRDRLDTHCAQCTAAGSPFCRCSHRHPFIVAQKAIAVSMFMRAQAYGRACVLDNLQNWQILNHPDKQVVELLLSVKESAHALLNHGDTHSGESAAEQQEHECVGLTKRTIGQIWQHDTASESRVRVASFARCAEVIEGFMAKGGRPGRQAPIGLAQHDKEDTALEPMLPAAAAVINDILKVGTQLTVPGDQSSKLHRPDLLFHRPDLAANKLEMASESVVQGISGGGRSHGFPTWAAPVPRSWVPPKPKVPVTAAAQARAAKAQAKARQQQDVQATMDGMRQIFLPGTDDMLTRGKVGEGKAELGMLLIKKYGLREDPNSSFLPVNLFANPKERHDFVDGDRVAPPGGGAAVRRRQYLLLVDALQHLQTEPHIEPGTVRTLQMLSRAVIKLFGRMLQPHHLGIVLCIDCAGFVTWLRSIVHVLARGKVMQAATTQDARFSKMTLNTELDDALPVLLQSKHGFLPRFLAACEHELHTIGDGWDANDHIRAGHFFAIVMGEEASAVFVAGGGTSVTFMQQELTRADLVACLDGQPGEHVVAQQGQGEAMLYKIILRFVGLLVSKGGTGLGKLAAFDLRSRDVDALAGYMIPTVVSLIAGFKALGMPTGLGATLRIMLSVHGKDDRKMREFGLLALQQRPGNLGGARCLGAPNGHLLEVVVDGFALYAAIEDDDDLPLGADGARALFITTVLLALGPCDVKRGLHGIGGQIRRMFAMASSPKFKKYVAAAGLGGLVTIEPPADAAARAVIAGAADEMPSCSFKLEPWAALALLYAVFAELPEIRRQLEMVYTAPKLADMTQRLATGPGAEAFDNYTVLRAAAVAGGGSVALPTPPALLAFLSQALVAFGQYTNWLGARMPRPATAAAEVLNSSYVVQPGGGVDLQYSVLTMRPPFREGPPLGDRGTPEFFAEQYSAALVDLSVEPLFRPFGAALARAFDGGNGAEPSTHVPMGLVVVPGTILSVRDVADLRSFVGRYAGKGGEGKVLREVVLHSFAQHTRFKAAGAPKIESIARPVTVEAVCTNGGLWLVDADEEEVGAAAAALPAAGAAGEEAAFGKYLAELLPQGEDVTAITARRGETMVDLLGALADGPVAGDTSGGSAGDESETAEPVTGYTRVRDLLMHVVQVAILGAQRHHDTEERDDEADDDVEGAEEGDAMEEAVEAAEEEGSEEEGAEQAAEETRPRTRARPGQNSSA